MRTSLFEQAEKALKSHSKQSRWLTVVLCLALAVSVGTFYTFIRPGQAKVRTEKLLVCQFAVHEHDESCFDEEDVEWETPLCGLADYVLHTHNDDCYDMDGKLVCELAELEEHQHDESCYSQTELLICDHEPIDPGHRHTDECYEEHVIEGSESECTLAEHVHTDDCYTETETNGEPVLTCGESEHSHSDSCYEVSVTEELTCDESEHSHSDSCYTVETTEELTCSDSDEEHGHDSGCYSVTETRELTCSESEHSHGSGCYTREETRELTCGESEHSHDGGCYSSGEAGTAMVLTCGEAEHTHDDSCSSEAQVERVLICEQEESEPVVLHDADCYERIEELVCGEEEFINHVHNKNCYDEEENLICGQVEAEEHIHGPECFITVTVGVDERDYTCGKTSHTHAKGCYGADGELRCPLEEHEHSGDCLPEPGWICGMEAHTHGEDCYNEAMELACGLEEHEHSADCLPEPEWMCGKMPHTHDETCYNADGELACPLEEHVHTGQCLIAEVKPELDWLCGLEEHTHSAECYNEDGELVCALEEHTHTELCLKSEEEIPWLCGMAAHTHDDACYDESGMLICGLEEHEHTRECLEGKEIEWLCGKAAHTHDESCYDENGELVCSLEEHEHTIDCLAAGSKWLCGLEEHTHNSDCYGEDGELICSLEEHEHTTACLVEKEVLWLCGKEEHTHDEMCYDATGEHLMCRLEEHTHTDDCLMLAETVMVSEEYAYTTESELFDIVFRVEGPAVLRTSLEDALFAEDAAPVGESSEEEDQTITFQVDALDDGECFELFSKEAEEREEMLLDVLSLHVLCEGRELDVSGCKVLAEITPTEVLRQAMEETAAAMFAIEDGEDAGQAEETTIRLTVREADEDGSINELESVRLDEASAEMNLDNVDVPMADGAAADSMDADVDSIEPMESDEPEEPEEPEEDWAFQTMYVVMRTNNVAMFAQQKAEEKFIVEYYAYIDRLVTSKNKDSLDIEPGDDFKALTVFDTEAPKDKDGNLTGSATLPRNGKADDIVKTMQIYVAKTALSETKDYKAMAKGDILRKKDVLTIIFDERDFDFDKYQYYGAELWNIINAPSENITADQIHYGTPKLWVYNDTGDLADETSWKQYEQPISQLTFTNNPDDESETCILLEAGKRFRLVYQTESGNFNNSAVFYDYDISDGNLYPGLPGTNAKGSESGLTGFGDPIDVEKQDELPKKKYYASTEMRGINKGRPGEAATNYHNDGRAKLVFGNKNTMNGAWEGSNRQWKSWATWSDGGVNNQLNGYNNANNSRAQGCTFGLATGLENGMIRFAVDTANIFNDERGGDVEGKTTYEGSSLTFDRQGDTYTLISAKADGGTEDGKPIKGAAEIGDLDKLSYVYHDNTSTIYSNEFWPLDGSGSHGTNGHDLKFGAGSWTNGKGPINIQSGADGAEYRRSLAWADGKYNWAEFPVADFQADARVSPDHNCYFGLNFAIDFKLTADYRGPLEYIFFGDDDLWVFLSNDGGATGQLVCDIGGVHSSVGEYVNLWDYVKDSEGKTKAGSYSLYFFYTERGASGSTCWMQFTIPQVSATTVSTDPGSVTNDLIVHKDVSGTETKDEFDFIIKLDTTGTGANAKSRYQYARYDINGASYGEGISWITTDESYHGEAQVQMRHGDYIKIFNLPKGAKYTVEETITGPYIQEVNGGVTNGTVTGAVTSTTDVNIINRYSPELPETGGPGIWVYTVGGVSLMAAAAYLALRRKKAN